MDIGSLGIDVGIIVAIGSLTELLKAQDIKNKLKRFYLFIPLVLSLLAAVGTALASKEYGSIFINFIKYFGISNFGYALIKKTIMKK